MLLVESFYKKVFSKNNKQANLRVNLPLSLSPSKREMLYSDINQKALEIMRRIKRADAI